VDREIVTMQLTYNTALSAVIVCTFTCVKTIFLSPDYHRKRDYKNSK